MDAGAGLGQLAAGRCSCGRRGEAVAGEGEEGGEGLGGAGGVGGGYFGEDFLELGVDFWGRGFEGFWPMGGCYWGRW